ncbi:MAG: trigger factor [Solirubrobacteraceae bacterium MAG38_C4-C5]|nr:trigger factor [Candidatus Siliceabacter maunaloa]
MPGTVTTSVTELPESRVRVEAQVDPKEVQRHVERTARRLGQDLRIPGFRKGKVPPGVIIQRLGRDAVLDEAVRDGMGHWYVQAIDVASIAPVGDPHLELDGLPDQGQPLSFSIEVGVRPTATLGDYKGMEVGRREPEADVKEVDDELEQLRERLAKLETVERPARDADFVVMDFTGTVDGVAFEGGSGTDQMVELGRGMLVPGFEEQLTGASAGDERTVDITFPEDYGNEDLKGRAAQFAVTVKDVREKCLPGLDDDLALEAAGFDSLDELREDVVSRLRDTDESKVAADFREAVLDAAVANASVEVPEPLVEARARESFEQMVHSLSGQGIAKETYLQITGKTEEELVAESRPQAEQQLRREAVIAAIVAAEGIEVSDDDLLEAIEPAAQAQADEAGGSGEEMEPKKVLERLRSQGRLDALRDDLAQRRAIELIAQEATPISVEEAKGKHVLWTPEKEQAGAGAGDLWTPGS